MKQTKAATQSINLRHAGGMMLLSLGLVWFATSMSAEETIIKSHGISSFGDLKYPADFKHFDYVNPNAPKGGTFSSRGTGASKTFDSLNPFILKGEPAQGLGALYDTLLTGSADEADSGYAYVAESLEYPESRQWVIFNIRPEATFQDGHPIEASDIVFSYNILLEKGHPGYVNAYKEIKSVEALSPRRVKFTFIDGANTRDLPALAGSISILPEHYYENVDFGESSLDVPLGSGQFTVVDAQPGRSIKYCRIDDYWGKDHPASVGTSNFDCIVYEYFSDNTAAFEALKSGGYVFHEEFFSKIWATGYDFPALTKGYVVKESIPDGRPSGTQGFWINLRSEKFQDIRVREALGYLFNFEWSNQTLFSGIYERTDSFWENSPLQASGMLEGDELAILEPFRGQIPDSVFDEPAYVPPTLTPNRSDRKALRAAGKLLDAAGWKIVNGKRTNDKGEVLKIEFVDDSPSFERIINPMVENFKRAGIDASYSLIDAAQMQERQKNYDYDIIPGRLVMSLTPGEEVSNVFGSRSADVPGTPNYTGLADPVIDALISQMAAAQSREQLTNTTRALDRVLRAKHIWIPQWFKPNHNIAYWDIFGRPETKPPYSRGVMGLWWIDQEKLADLKAKGAL